MRQLKITKAITNRALGSLDKYLADISRVELISPEEEVKLAQRIREGDEVAMQRLCCANLRFVVSVAKQYQHQGLSLPDLINEGNLGLIKAAQKFDETKGFKFISYAVWWIRQSILQALAEHSRIVRLPLNQVGFLGKVKKTASALEQQYERLPSLEEIAADLDIPESKIENIVRISASSISMDAPISDDEEATLADVYIEDEYTTTDNILMKESLDMEIKRVLGTLSDKEREILFMYYGIGHKHSYSLEEIGAKFDLTRERVRQIKEKAIRRIKNSPRSRLLKSYL